MDTHLTISFLLVCLFMHKIGSREAESENASLVVQGMLMDFECRFSQRKGWRIIFDVSLYLDSAHIFGIHGNAKEPL